ncbi:unnamed protein product, partial [Protopolystoma xenopodis]
MLLKKNAIFDSVPPVGNNKENIVSLPKSIECPLSTELSSPNPNLRRFVIELGTSSDSDSDQPVEEGNQVRVIKSTAFPPLFKPPSKPTHIHQSRIPLLLSLHSSEKRLLKHRHNLSRLKASIYRQSNLISQRESVQKQLSELITKLKVRLRKTVNLHRQASTALVKARHAENRLQSKYSAEVKSYSEFLTHLRGLVEKQANTTSKDIDSHRKSADPGDRLINRHKETLRLLFGIFQRAKFIQIFNNFLLFRRSPTKIISSVAYPTAECVSNGSEHSDSLISIDPYLPLCPFILDGECIDPACTYQHLIPKEANFKLCTLKPINRSPPILCSIPESSGLELVRSGTEFCEVCCDNIKRHIPINPSSSENLLRIWHAAFCYWKQNEKISLKRFQAQSRRIFESSPLAYGICKHHLHALSLSLKSPQTNYKSAASSIFRSLLTSEFPLDACKFAFRLPKLSLKYRRILLFHCLKYMIDLSHTASVSVERQIDLILPFTFIVYHCLRIDLEYSNQGPTFTLLDNLLSDEGLLSLAPKHLFRWSVWHLRLLLDLTSPNFFDDSSIFLPLVSYPNNSKLVSMRDVFVAATKDLNLEQDLLNVIDRFALSPNCLGSLYAGPLAVGYLYILYVIAEGRLEPAFTLCLRLSLCLPCIVKEDDFFFPLAVQIFLRSKQASGSASEFLSEVSKLFPSLTSDDLISHRIEYAFISACHAWQKKRVRSAASILEDLIIDLVHHLPSTLPSTFAIAFRVLLNIADQYTLLRSLHSFYPSTSRSRCYLWLCYILYQILHSCDLDKLLKELKSYVLYSSDHSFDVTPIAGGVAHPWPISRSLLFAGLQIASRLTNDSAYIDSLTSLLLASPNHILPTSATPWLTGLIQEIDLERLSSPEPRSSICMHLVERYGYAVVPLICRSLFALGDTWLAERLCDIAALDQPDSEEFWLLHASLKLDDMLRIRSYEPRRDKRDVNSAILIDILSQGILSVPSSIRLWQEYSAIVRDLGDGVSRQRLTDAANLAGLNELVEDILSRPPGTEI